MNNKKVKRFLGCVCALTLLLGSIPVNGIVASAEDETEQTYVNVLDNENITLHGVTYDEEAGIFARMDLDTAADIAGVDRENYSFTDDEGFINNVYSHVREAAGGRIRFSTASSYVAIKATLQDHDPTYAWRMVDGKYGFDVYEDTAEGSTYVGTVSVETVPTEAGVVTVEGTVELGEAGTTRHLTIYFPITTETKSVEIGVESGYDIAAHGVSYNDSVNRILFYGSSITQGGAVSKPGNTYVNTVGRNLNMDYLNLGVWGSCKAQVNFAKYMVGEYLANSEDNPDGRIQVGNISAFVYDYDHNNSQASVLESTHYPFYEIIREAYPDIPIIMITRPGKSIESDPKNSTVAEMKAVIYESYEKAVAAGDTNVHFIDGEAFFGYSKAFLPDNVHPNDAGQAKMAEIVTAVLERAFAGEKNLCVEPANCENVLFEDNFENGIDTTYWKTNQTGIKDTAFNIIQQNENDQAGQITYTRTAGQSGYGGVYYNSALLKNHSNYVIEMDTTLYRGTVLGEWSYLELSLRKSGDSGKFNIRVAPKDTGWAVRLYDETGDVDYTDSKNIVDDDFAAVFGSATQYDCHLRVGVEYITNSDGSTSFAITVYVNDNQAGFYINPSNQDWTATAFRIFMYGGSTTDTKDETYKADIDDIKVYDMSHTLEAKTEVPATTEQLGKKAHLECTVCGKKFMDEAAIFEVTAADLAIATNCSLVNETFDSDLSNWTIKSENYDTYQFSAADSICEMQFTKTGANSSTQYAYMQYNKGILNGRSNYVVEMDDVGIYKNTSVSRWSSMGLMFRDKDSGSTLEFWIQAHTSGLNIVPYYNGDKYDESDYSSLKYIKIHNDELAAMNSAGKYSVDLRVEVKGMGTDSITCTFTVGETEGSIIIPNFEINPTGLRLYLHGGGKSDSSTIYEASIGNLRVYTESHTITAVEAKASTDDTAGTKAHYKCTGCGKKFSDAAGTIEVTDADLAYWKLLDVLCQTRDNKTDSSIKDIRFVAYVDDYTKYSGVMFTITCGDKTGSATTTNVYQRIYAGGELYATQDLFGVTTGYFATFVLSNTSQALRDQGMTVTATWIPADGSEPISNDSRTIAFPQ